MRDPQAAIVFQADRVERQLYRPLPKNHFLNSSLARRLVEAGQLVPYTVVSDTRLESPRLPFVTYPYEWCDAQFRDAAQTTLTLLKEAVAAGYDLKDASAWNIIFSGCKPQFCDLMSFEPLASKQWWALGQFLRHFIWPLLLSSRRGVPCRKSFMIWRDGVPTDRMVKLIGRSLFASRYLPFLLGSSTTALPPSSSRPEQAQGFRRSVIAMLEWCVPKASALGRSVWADYERERDHYSAQALSFKKATIARWLADIRPVWVADLGCNAGEFSILAADSGAKVIAVDSDHQCIQILYQRAQGRTDVFPVVAALDDIVGGRGWQGREFPGLVERLNGHCDVVLGLALVHHLAIAASVPLNAVAGFFHSLTRQWAIIELIDTQDLQLQSLCVSRRRNPADFSIDAQRAALVSAGFSLHDFVPVPDSHRQLVLVRKA